VLGHAFHVCHIRTHPPTSDDCYSCLGWGRITLSKQTAGLWAGWLWLLQTLCITYRLFNMENEDTQKPVSILAVQGPGIRMMQWIAFTKFYGSISDRHGVRHVYTYCNRKIIVCRLPDADWQRHIDKFESLGNDKLSVLTRFRELSGRTIQFP